MSYKIAVASSDGKVVNQHFGHSRQFIVFEVNDVGKWSVIEIRTTNPVCGMGEHNDSSMQKAVKLLSDCKIVLVSQIGYGAQQALKSEGIEAYIISNFIDIALVEVVNYIGSKNYFE
ncbi:MAG TPA: NifB/NifX family molybdenum-iron cluster-binding protein [Ruminiclostridium sp.]